MEDIARLKQQLIDAEKRHKEAEANLYKLCTQFEDLLAERTRELAPIVRALRTSRLGHVGILGDERCVERCLAFLEEGRGTGRPPRRT